MTVSSQIDVGNPLGYHCAPNGAGADVIAETDLHRFVAYGFVVSCDYMADSPQIFEGNDDLYWLRVNFIDAVRLAVEEYGDLKPGDRYTGEQPDNHVETDHGRLGWEFESRAADCLTIALNDGEDGKALFLHLDAVANPDHVRQVLHDAIVMNERLLQQEA